METKLSNVWSSPEGKSEVYATMKDQRYVKIEFESESAIQDLLPQRARWAVERRQRAREAALARNALRRQECIRSSALKSDPLNP
jgi:hypothetical protein